MSTEAKANMKDKEEGGFLDTIRVIIHALILAFIVRIFLYQPFNIPSGSMIPTLLVGDYLFVSKFSYGYSKYSLPFSPNLFSGRILASDPKRGDVVVFKLPADNETDYIKRVVGLPGDSIQMIRGVLHINGTPVERHRDRGLRACATDGRERKVPRYKETLPNGVSYETLDCPGLRGRRYAGLRCAAGPLFHDGRQSRQLHRQPLLRRRRGRLCAAREPDRPCRDHLLLHR